MPACLLVCLQSSFTELALAWRTVTSLLIDLKLPFLFKPAPAHVFQKYFPAAQASLVPSFLISPLMTLSHPGMWPAPGSAALLPSEYLPPGGCRFFFCFCSYTFPVAGKTSLYPTGSLLLHSYHFESDNILSH